MRRRDLLAGSLMTATVAGLPGFLSEDARAQDEGSSPSREFYELRRYQLRNGPGSKLVHDYLRDAAIPALNRAGIKPVGVFNGMVGPENPSTYMLAPYPSLQAIATVARRLASDEEYQSRAADYLNAPATQPAYVRFESFVLEAFETVPRIETPQAAVEKRPRIFELRTYENPSEKANQTKVRMFNTAEIAIFRRTGLTPVFFGNALVGSHMPHLTYMLTFDSVEDREKKWRVFGSDPAWKKLSTTPGYTDPEIITNITNVFLSPAAYSQI
ncbi:MAG: NIPSNAP family protein [Terriglobia bacterium]